MPRYSATLLEHAKYPSNRGAIETTKFVGHSSLIGNPPFISIYVCIKEGKIVDASFESQGCGVTTAICSVTTELLKDRRLNSLPDQDEIVAELDGVPADKLHCVQIVLQAVSNAVALMTEG